ncbi:hypothetical protein ACP3T3_07085 [Chryseobacterium sp. CBSDS_008]|uniref:hypothetical protein n=1 Tax=Chryseobacterium sp. CBSDS_008 TaxID=3415265 RepID=UPI003CF57A93
MKKNVLVLTTFLSSMMYSQVGINTPNPQGMFHVDGGKDNPITGVPTSAQQSNDLMMSAAGNVGLGTVTPQTKLHVAGEITVDVTKNSSIHSVTVDMSRIRASAGTTWHLPMGWQADGSLAVLPGQLETAVNVNESNNGTVLIIPSTLWGVGVTDTLMYSLMIEGLYSNHCIGSNNAIMTIYITHGGMNVTLNGVEQGTLSNPSTDVTTWTSPAACNRNVTFSYNSTTRVLSYANSDTAGRITLNGTATLYGWIIN